MDNSKQISIPNIFETPFCEVTAELNNTLYILYFHYNDREDITYLDIYRIQDETKIYLVKGFPLRTQSGDITKYCNDEKYDGALYFKNKKDVSAQINPNIKNISTDFCLIHYLE